MLNMNIEMFRKALEKVDKSKLSNVNFNSRTAKFFDDYHISEEVTTLFKEFSYAGTVQFNHIKFDSVNEMPENNLYEEHKRCIDNGLFIIGHGLNGDLIVLDLNTNEIGYVFHDELWEDEEINPREIHISLECSLPEFYFNSVTIDNYPVDGTEAERYMEKKR
jgi:hypothetical protein